MSRSGGGGTLPLQSTWSSHITRAERDFVVPASYSFAPTCTPRSLHSSSPPSGRRDQKQDMKFTPWTLNLTSETHKCADLNLFRTPKPQPPASSSSNGTVSRSRQPAQGPSNGVGRARRNPLRRGTVVLPILPGPKRTMPFLDVSVMTLSNVLYTPGKKHSELSWRVLEQQGFTRHMLHDSHGAHRSSWEHARQHRDGANRARIAGGLVSLQGALRNSRGGPRDGYIASDDCGRSSAIRHPSIPGVDLLCCIHNKDVLTVLMPAAAMVDMRAWSWGVENGIVGKGARFNAGDPYGQPVGWIVRYGGKAPDAEPEEGDVEDLFRRIVQGASSLGESNFGSGD